MLSFRSPLLRAPAAGPRPHSLRLGARRGLQVAFVAAVVAWLSWSVSREAFGDHWFGWAMYRLHDHVVLPVVGWTWTRLHPYSMIAWALVGLALAAYLVHYVTGIHLLRGWHHRWTRWALRRRTLHPVLLAGCAARASFRRAAGVPAAGAARGDPRPASAPLAGRPRRAAPGRRGSRA